MLTFRFRERLFSYFRFALMERFLSISRKSAYWRNVISDGSELQQNSQVNLRRWKIEILRTYFEKNCFDFCEIKKRKNGVNKIDKNSIEKIEN